jgi:predicted DNA-binding ribbon-helix-helix protein
MSMLDRRLQVLIDEERWERLTEEAERRRVSVAVLVREAIDERYPDQAAVRRAALRRVLQAEPMEVPDPEELRKELDEIRGRRF